MMDLNVTVIEAIDTTNTPFDPVRDVTDFVTEEVFGCIVVDFENVVDVDSLTSCVPSINCTMNELPDVDL